MTRPSDINTLIPEATCTSLKEAARKGLRANFGYLGAVLDETVS